MKKITLLAFAASFIIISCQREAHRDVIPLTSENTETVGAAPAFNLPESGKGGGAPGTCNPNAFTVLLESKSAVADGWEWTWSVQNPNPGNGNNGTAQDLSHWGMQFGSCFLTTSMVSAAYSADGVNWTSFTPAYTTDPSQGCMASPVLKFDFGTQGTAKSYYRLVVNTDYAMGSANAYYKSGGNTGCCTFSVTGIGCEEAEGPR